MYSNYFYILRLDFLLMKKNLNNIIIVDDQNAFRILLMSYLEHHNFNVIAELKNGRELVDFYKTKEAESVQVAIVDFDMPEMNGCEAIRTIQQNSLAKKTKFILLSDHLQNKTIVHEAMNMKIDGYLYKRDFEFDIVTAIRTVLTNQDYLSPMVKDIQVKLAIFSHIYPDLTFSDTQYSIINLFAQKIT